MQKIIQVHPHGFLLEYSKLQVQCHTTQKLRVAVLSVDMLINFVPDVLTLKELKNEKKIRTILMILPL